MNISSVVVKTSPQHVEEVAEELKGSELCEVFFHDKQGRIVVTIEDDGVSGELKKLKAIQSMRHVLSAELSYAYTEEFTEAMEYFDKSRDSVPEALDDDETDARQINYGGDVKI